MKRRPQFLLSILGSLIVILTLISKILGGTGTADLEYPFGTGETSTKALDVGKSRKGRPPSR